MNQTEANRRNTRILVVEDENIIALDLRNTLRSLGFEVPAVVATGPESIEKASSISPDLVLMDVKLKGEMDGISAAEQITTRFRIPVIYITAFGDQKTLDRISKIQPFALINKPFVEQELEDAIENMLGEGNSPHLLN